MSVRVVYPEGVGLLKSPAEVNERVYQVSGRVFVMERCGMRHHHGRPNLEVAPPFLENIGTVLCEPREGAVRLADFVLFLLPL